MLRYYIDLLDVFDAPLGSGPVTTATFIDVTKRLDKAGEFSFEVPSTEPQLAYITPRTKVTIWWIKDGSYPQELTRGVIDRIEHVVRADGVMWHVSGDDGLRELTWTSPGFIDLQLAGASISEATALAMLQTYMSGWTFAAAGTPATDSVYYSTTGESILTLLGKVAEQTQDHFYNPLNSPTTVKFVNGFSDSGVRAIAPGVRSEPEDGLCFIVNIGEIRDTYDLITRIYPYGERTNPGTIPATYITLINAARTAPTGFTHFLAGNWIRNDAAETAYGIVARYVQYSEIKALSGGFADQQSASNALYDVAIRELSERCQINYNYRIELAGCSDLLYPGSTIRIVYRRVIDGVVILDIDDDFNILEVTTRLLPNQAAQTVGIQVSSAYRPPFGERDWVVLAEKNRQLK